MLELFRQTLDTKGAEFCVLVADLADFLEFGRIAVGFKCFHAVPGLQGNALLRWCTFNRRYVLSDSKEPATGFLNQSLSFRHVLLQIGIEVFHIDFRNNVERRFSLSVYILDRHGAKYKAYNDRQRQSELRFHGCPLPVMSIDESTNQITPQFTRREG